MKRGSALISEKDDHINDKDMVIAALYQRSLSWYHVPDTLKYDRDVVIAAINGGINVLLMESTTNEIRADHEIALLSISKFEGLFDFILSQKISPELLCDLSFVKAIILKDVNVLSLCSHEIRDNTDLIMFGLNQKCGLLAARFFRWASPRIRAIKKIAYQAICKNGHMIKFVEESLKHDRDLVLAACTSEIPCSIKQLPAQYYDDTEIIYHAFVSYGPMTLRVASERLTSGALLLYVKNLLEDHLRPLLLFFLCARPVRNFHESSILSKLHTFELKYLVAEFIGLPSTIFKSFYDYKHLL